MAKKKTKQFSVDFPSNSQVLTLKTLLRKIVILKYDYMHFILIDRELRDNRI